MGPATLPCPEGISANLKPYFTNLPPENTEKAFRGRLKEKPVHLVQFVKEILFYKEWVSGHQDLIQKLFKSITKKILTGALPPQTADSFCELFKRSVPTQAHLAPQDVLIDYSSYRVNESQGGITLTATKDLQPVSRLILMGNAEYFRAFFKNNFVDSNKQVLFSEKFAVFLKFNEFQACWDFMQNGNAEKLSSLDIRSLWSIVKQSHLWGHLPLKAKVEQLLITKIKTILDALESLNGCDMYELKDLRAHCCTIIFKSNIRLRERSDGTLGVSFHKVTPENLSELRDIDALITHLKVSTANLQGVPIDNVLATLPDLTSLHLMITEKGISQTALQLLAGGKKIRCLKILPDRQSKDLTPASPAPDVEGSEQVLQVEQLDIQKLPLKFRRVVLGLIKAIPIKDLRAQHCPFVSDDFIQLMSLTQAPAAPPPLRGLDLGDCTKITDNALRMIVKTYLGLEVLNLSNTLITMDGLLFALRGLPLLHNLNISRCSHLGKDILRVGGSLFQNIRTLKLGGCRSYGDEDFTQLFTHAQKLEYLYIFGCKNFNIHVMRPFSLVHLHTLWVDAQNFNEVVTEVIFSAQNYPKLKEIHVTGSPNPQVKERAHRAIGVNSTIKLDFIDDKFT